MTAIEDAALTMCPPWCTGEHDIERDDLCIHEGPVMTVRGDVVRFSDIEAHLEQVTFTDRAPGEVLVVLDNGDEWPIPMVTELAHVLRELAGIGRRST